MAGDSILDRMEEQGLGLLIENDARLVFASDRSALAALQTVAFRRPELLDGSDVAVPAVGLAVAYLLIYSKVGRIFTRVMTRAARAAFREEGIEHVARSVAKKLPKTWALESGEADALAEASVTPRALFEELRRRSY